MTDREEDRAHRRVWVVTGGSRGIGRAIVDRAQGGGDTVYVMARSATSDTWPATDGDRIRPLAADVTDPESVARAFAVVEQAGDRVDVLVHCAGLHRGGRIDRIDETAWADVLDTNLTGAFHTVRGARPLLGEGASVISIGAVVGLRGYPGDVAYGSAKAGLAGFTRTLAIELAPRGVRVNLVVPGFVDTDMTSGLTTSSRAAVVDGIPLGRPGRPDEIADVVWAVAGASYMTGSTIAVDGGLLASFGAPGRRAR